MTRFIAFLKSKLTTFELNDDRIQKYNQGIQAPKQPVTNPIKLCSGSYGGLQSYGYPVLMMLIVNVQALDN